MLSGAPRVYLRSMAVRSRAGFAGTFLRSRDWASCYRTALLGSDQGFCRSQAIEPPLRRQSGRLCDRTNEKTRHKHRSVFEGFSVVGPCGPEGFTHLLSFAKPQLDYRVYFAGYSTQCIRILQIFSL